MNLLTNVKVFISNIRKYENKILSAAFFLVARTATFFYQGSVQCQKFFVTAFLTITIQQAFWLEGKKMLLSLWRHECSPYLHLIKPNVCFLGIIQYLQKIVTES